MWLVPPQMHDPIRQDAVLLQAGHGNPAARALLAFMHSDAARAIVRAYGYMP
jgi:molybdate transport system substrate-binding protein